MRVYILLALIAAVVTMLLTPAARRFALTFRVLSPLRDRDVHVVPTPRMGGLAMTAGFGVAMLVGSKIPYLGDVFDDSVIWAVILGAIAICILGAVDDVIELDWIAKLAGQVLIAVVVSMNGVQLISFPLFGLTIGSSRLSVLVSVLIIVTIMNAVNFVDGLDGLAAGVAAIGGISFFSYSYLLTRETNSASYATVAAVIMVAMVGACIGFLWYNFHPASIFMGDSGAMVLGFLIASAGIIVTGQVRPNLLEGDPIITSVLPVILPFVVIIIPLIDLIFTALGRILRGQSPTTADRTHLHDRLLDAGHSHRGVVLVLWAWTALVCAVGVTLLVVEPKKVAIAGLAATAVLIAVTWQFFPGMRKRKRKTNRGIGVPGGTKAVDDGIKVISRQQRWHPIKHAEEETK
jgi:UDP-N-acetylmuramyl pentapeptide phosphotransferase/UDP-N-acetylglucosamine-1-phosphate transferase